MKLTLFHYWRSSSSWRVRWALAEKGLSCDFVHVSLLNGESESEAHLKRSPLGYVPALEVDGKFLTESMAILEWLEETNSSHPLFPGDPWTRARIRQLCETINASTQPVQNSNVLERVSDLPEKKKEWAQHFIRNGLSAYEKLLKDLSGRFSVGDTLTAADLFLVPQLYNARRQRIALDHEFPRLVQIEKNALATRSGLASHPDRFNPESSHRSEES